MSSQGKKPINKMALSFILNDDEKPQAKTTINKMALSFILNDDKESRPTPPHTDEEIKSQMSLSYILKDETPAKSSPASTDEEIKSRMSLSYIFNDGTTTKSSPAHTGPLMVNNQVLTPPPTKSPKMGKRYIMDDTAIPFATKGGQASTPRTPSPADFSPSTPSPPSSPTASLSSFSDNLTPTAVQSETDTIWPPPCTAIVHVGPPRLPGIDYNNESTWVGQQGKNPDVPPKYLAQKLANYPEYKKEPFQVPGKMTRDGKIVRKKTNDAPSWNFACYTALAFIQDGEASSQVIFQLCVDMWPGLVKQKESKRPTQTCEATLTRGKNSWCMEATGLTSKGMLGTTGRWRLMNRTGEVRAEMKPGGRSPSSSSNSSSSSLSPPPSSTPSPKRKRTTTRVPKSTIKTTFEHEESENDEHTIGDPTAKRARTDASVPTWNAVNKPNPLLPEPARTPLPNARIPGIGARPYTFERTIVAPKKAPLLSTTTSTEPKPFVAPVAHMYDAITLDEDMRSIGRGTVAKKTKPVKPVKPVNTVEIKAVKTDRRGYPTPPDLNSPYFDRYERCGLTQEQFVLWKARFEVTHPDPYGISYRAQRTIDHWKSQNREYIAVETRDPKVPRDPTDTYGLIANAKRALEDAFLDGTMQMFMDGIVATSFSLGPTMREEYHDHVAGQTELVPNKKTNRYFPNE